jgi:hypothetical protein
VLLPYQVLSGEQVQKGFEQSNIMQPDAVFCILLCRAAAMSGAER